MTNEDKVNWAKLANEGKKYELIEPVWSWDCQSKLDFDGSLCRVSTRLYPCGEGKWAGEVNIMIKEESRKTYQIESQLLDSAKQEVEKITQSIFSKLETVLNQIEL